MVDTHINRGRRIRKLLVLLTAELAALGKATLLPPASSLWHSLADFLVLVGSGDKPGRIAAAAGNVLQRVERGIETLLPQSLHHRFPVKTIGLLLLLILAFWLGSADSTVDDLKQSGELVVITRESPTTLIRDGNGTSGPEYDYLSSFAAYLGVDLRLDIRDSARDVLDAINGNEGHIAAAGMTYYPPLEEEGLVFGPPYQQVDVLVVCRRNHGKQPRGIEDLAGIDLVVAADSVYESRLFELQQDYPGLTWESDEEASVDELLQLVWRREIGCTIANSSELNIKRRFYPELQVAFTLDENRSLVWNLSPEWQALGDAIDQWLAAIEKDGTLLILQDRHYKIDEFDYVDMRTFVRRMHSRLPKLEPMFRNAADKHGIPWTLLAAQAYQESHWNRRAKSPTGVRGIMMLTLATAKEMGVESRLDAEQSIMGGARYLASLERRIPDAVTGDDRWWYALAAYNVGMGHLKDARYLAEDLGLDPNSWLDLRGVLPLLSQKKYYQDLRYGRARGHEPVTYVGQVRNYQNILHAQMARQRGIHAG